MQDVNIGRKILNRKGEPSAACRVKIHKKVPAHSTEKFRTSQGAVNRESKIETVFRQLSVDRRVALRVAPQ